MTQWGLDTLFNPAKRHLDEEKRRLQSTREEVGDNSGGKRIDLEAGKVRIHKGDENESEATIADQTPGAEAVIESSADAKADSKSRSRRRSRADRDEDGKPSEAAIRAAKRRGRSL